MDVGIVGEPLDTVVDPVAEAESDDWLVSVDDFTLVAENVFDIEIGWDRVLRDTDVLSLRLLESDRVRLSEADDDSELVSDPLGLCG
jgi:hypothetical protein